MNGLATALAASAVALVAAGAPAPSYQAALPASALPLRLTGILYDQGQPARSACLIRCVAQPGRQGIFSVGDRACDVAEIREVRQDAVVIENLEAKTLELLAFPRVTPRAAAPPRAPAPVPDSAPPPEPLQVAVPTEAVQAAIANLPELLSSAFAVPRYRDVEGGQRVIDGFEVTQVKPSGAAERLGLRNGDVILDVNGQILDGMPTVMRLFGQLQATPQVTITVLRDGRRMNVVFNTK
ncbi:MAG: PDZ domain-containing protein [Vicinamibacterales bacterium]|jgi:type II secretion system protein C|nr:PDZ domain-containing protein [Vicinamibacterales bacterium]